MINGVRVRDSGVELSPTGTDRRGGPRTASNRTVRASSAIAAGSTRWLMRRTKRPLSANSGGPGHPWPPMATYGHATYGHLWPHLWPPMATYGPTYGQLWPPMANYGHLWPPLYSQVAHCYALVKTPTRGTAQGLPAAFPGRLNQLETGRPYWGSA